MDNDLLLIGIFLLVTVLTAAALGLTLILQGPGRAKKRLQDIENRFKAKNVKKSASVRSIMSDAPGTRFDEWLRGFLPRRKELHVRLQKTGKNISVGKYVGISLGVAAFSGLAAFFFLGHNPLLSLALALLMGFAFPHLAVSMMIKKRSMAFLALFPDAIDLITRGLRSGLPISESINAVGREIDDPVGIEFRRINNEVKVGKTLEQALWETADRLDTPDFKFFVISLSVQRETGGNLAETLGNLSEILRKRHQMKLKIKAMSAESKASAYIVGALPFIMFALLLTIDYEYASTLFMDIRAIFVSIGALVWMGIGVFFMAKMVRFEI